MRTDLVRTLPESTVHLRLGSRVPLGAVFEARRSWQACQCPLQERPCEDSFCRWLEGTGPRQTFRRCTALEQAQDLRATLARAMMLWRKMDNERVCPPLQ